MGILRSSTEARQAWTLGAVRIPRLRLSVADGCREQVAALDSADVPPGLLDVQRGMRAPVRFLFAAQGRLWDGGRAMSQENVEIVRSVYADPSGLAGGASGKVAPHAEFDFSEVYPDGPVVRGVEELRRFRNSGPWGGSPIRFTPERFFDVDDEQVLVFLRVSATGQESGAQVEIPVAHAVTIRDALVVHVKVYGNRAEALEAVGLRE